MELYTTILKSFKNLSLSLIGGVMVVSCTATQQVYDEDGIYSSSESVVVQEDQERVTDASNANVYKNYFEKGAQELEEIEEEGAVFTDIESYSSEDGSEIYIDESSFDASTGYAAWGDDPQDVEVNIYNNSPLWGFNRWGGFGFGYGWGGYGLGWNRGFGWGGGFGNPYWGGGFWNPYWGGGFYNPYWGGGFGYAFNHPYGFYGNNFYAYNRGYRGGRVAYNTGRRTAGANVGRRSRNATDAIAASRSRLRASSGRNVTSRSRATYSRNRGTARPTNGRGTSYSDGISRGRPGSAARDGVSRGRPTTAQRPSNGNRPNAYGRPATSTRPKGSRPSRPNANRPSRPSRPSGTSTRPSSRPSRPAARPSRPSSSRSGSFSRSSSSSRSSGVSRGGGSSRSSGGRSGGRRG